MYEDFFGFERKPFNVTPDPDFIYYSDQHKEALAHMLYGVQERRGFILVTGRVGSGKTTLCRAFMRELDEDTSTALILNSKMGPTELLESIAEDFGIDLPDNPSHKDVLDALKEFVLNEYENGRNACLIVDESQNLSPDALEQLRLLSNLETEKEKLLQIVLSGQPELENMLNRSELRQLKQRIAVKSYLSNLDEDATREYVQHRIALASNENPNIQIDPTVYQDLYEATGGNPRAINLIGDRMLMAAYIDESPRVEQQHLRKAIEDLADDVPGSEERDTLVLHRLLKENRISRDQVLSYLSGYAQYLKHPVTIGLVAALLTIGIGLAGVSFTNPLLDGPTVVPPSNTEVDSLAENPAAAGDTATATVKGDTAGPSEPAEPLASANESSSETESASTEPADTTVKASSGSNKQNTEPASDQASDQSNQRESEQAAEQTQETTSATEETQGDEIFTKRSYLDRQDPSREQQTNPLGIQPLDRVEELRQNPGNRSLVMSIARYLSYYVATRYSSDRTNQFEPLESIRSDVSGERLLGEVLSAQALPLEGTRRQLLRYETPAFLLVRNNGIQRYVLYLPEEDALWDPVTGWLRNPGAFLPISWKGFGFVVAQADFDMTRLMDYGLKGPRVLELQELLNGAGDYNIPRIDRYGPKTQSSVEDFQRRADLPVDGVAGPETYLALLKANDRSIELSSEEVRSILNELRGGEPDVTDQGSTGQGSGEDGGWNVF